MLFLLDRSDPSPEPANHSYYDYFLFLKRPSICPVTVPKEIPPSFQVSCSRAGRRQSTSRIKPTTRLPISLRRGPEIKNTQTNIHIYTYIIIHAHVHVHIILHRTPHTRTRTHFAWVCLSEPGIHRRLFLVSPRQRLITAFRPLPVLFGLVLSGLIQSARLPPTSAEQADDRGPEATRQPDG